MRIRIAFDDDPNVNYQDYPAHPFCYECEFGSRDDRDIAWREFFTWVMGNDVDALTLVVDGTYLVIGIAREKDAVLFKLRFCG